jgi:hypothetical protein
VEKTVNLSKGGAALKNSCLGMIEELRGTGITPHEIADRIMAHIRKGTGRELRGSPHQVRISYGQDGY